MCIVSTNTSCVLMRWSHMPAASCAPNPITITCSASSIYFGYYQVSPSRRDPDWVGVQDCCAGGSLGSIQGMGWVYKGGLCGREGLVTRHQVRDWGRKGGKGRVGKGRVCKDMLQGNVEKRRYIDRESEIERDRGRRGSGRARVCVRGKGRGTK